MIYGATLEHHASLGSTMDLATQRAQEGAPEGLVVVADTQTAGRGQRHRRWCSPPGAGLYFSLLLRPQVPPEQVSLFTLAAGVAVQAALQPSCPAALGLKWPNDVLVREPGPHYGKKLAGLLMEAGSEGGQLSYAVLGVGLNLQEAAFPPALQPAAVCLAQLGDQTLQPEPLLQAILTALDRELRALEAGGAAALAARWSEVALGLNTEVHLDQGDHQLSGPLLGLGEDGSLRLGGHPPQLYGRLHIPGLPQLPELP